jgi:prepilin peptidase CpaA
MSAIPLDDLLIVATLVVCAATDVRTGKIYNAVTYPALALGLAYAISPRGAGLPVALAGLLAGGLPLYLFFAAGWMGGGDVKLMAAIGAIKGFPFIITAMFYSIFIAGVCAALLLIWRGQARATLGDVTAAARRAVGAAAAPIEPRGGSFPFGAAMAMGTLIAVVLAAR